MISLSAHINYSVAVLAWSIGSIDRLVDRASATVDYIRQIWFKINGEAQRTAQKEKVKACHKSTMKTVSSLSNSVLHNPESDSRLHAFISALS